MLPSQSLGFVFISSRHSLGVGQPLIYRPSASQSYAFLLQHNTRAASIFHLWRRGKAPSNDDYLFLRAPAFPEPTNHPSPTASDQALTLQKEAALTLLAEVLNEANVRRVTDLLLYYLGSGVLSPVRADVCYHHERRAHGHRRD